MLIINVEKSGGIEKALKKLKSKFKNTQVLKELRERKEFTKPSVKRRDEHKSAVHREIYRRKEL